MYVRIWYPLACCTHYILYIGTLCIIEDSYVEHTVHLRESSFWIPLKYPSHTSPAKPAKMDTFHYADFSGNEPGMQI